MTRRFGLRAAGLWVVAGLLVSVWVFPVLWGLLTSFKTERDVLAYPPLLMKYASSNSGSVTSRP